MADWNKPTTSSLYSDYTSELDGRLKDLALANDPALVTPSNAPTNMVRWSGASARWEKYSGTAWNVLASTYNINVATAAAWASGRTISITGDLLATSAAWTGSANLSFVAALPTVNTNVGSFGSASAVPIITVNAKGLITGVSTTSLGTIASQSAAAVAITGGAISATTLTLKQSTTSAPSAEGVIEWDTDDDLVKVGTGTGTKTQVNTDSAQSLTNKTMGVGSLWSGTAVGILYGGTGASDVATARSNLGIGSVATQNSNAVSLTGGSISGTSLTLVQSTSAAPTAEGVIEWDTDNDLLVLGTAVGTKIQVNTDTAQTLTNKSISGAANAITAIANGSLVNSSVTLNGSAVALGGTLVIEPYIEADISTAANRYITFVDSAAAGYQRLKVDTGISYNPSTNVLTVTAASAQVATNVAYSGLTGEVPTWNQNTTGNSATATSAAALTTAGFSIAESGGKLYFKYGATSIASMSSTGVFTAIGDVLAGGTP